MSDISIPGFTADASLYRGGEHYRHGAASEPTTRGVKAALHLRRGLSTGAQRDMRQLHLRPWAVLHCHVGRVQV